MKKQIIDFPIFAMGFRAFFALSGIFSLILIALWASIFDGSVVIDNYYPKTIWHAHEMLLGYSVAVIAGFLLTAVENWTGIETVKGKPLVGLCLLWIYGRLVAFYSELLPDTLIALVDISFLPVLTYFVAKPIIQSGNVKNLFFVALLLLMVLANGFIHAEILGYSNDSAGLGLDIVIAIIVVMILVIAGRIFPFFTERGLQGVMAIRNPLLDKLAIASSALVFILLIFDVNGFVLTVCAILAVIANIARVSGWYVQRIWYVPLLWVLYMGYAWIILGFVFVALASVSLVPTSLAIHAFTVGGIGVITLGMMARVSLGHTGRMLKASNTIAIAFALINLAVVFRVIMPAILPAGFNDFLLISTYFWLAAFALFVFIYTPILSSVRVDSRKG
jgi:uncharacterized protein involved in response to NO